MSNSSFLSRRDLLRASAMGFGNLAFLSLMAERGLAVTDPTNPLAPKAPMFPARAKRVIFVFLHGGPSQVDTFDPKPLLTRDHGKPFTGEMPRIVSSPTGNLLRSPWEFKHYGQSGIQVSDLFPHVGACVDDLCFINSMHASNSRHGGALLELHTGSDTFVRPSMGSWVTYGLGTENQDMPGFVTICPTLSHGGVNNWSSAFLPAYTQGTPVGNASIPAGNAKIPFIQNKETPRAAQQLEIELLQKLSQEQLRHLGPDPALEGRLTSFELAFRMQMAAPELQEITGESEETKRLYGIDEPKTKNFGHQCLLARRFSEKGVRFVQVTHSYKWDQHTDLRRDHASNAMEVDKPIAGLITDLKARGMLQDTLVMISGEFGRTPVAQGDDGRDHNPHGFTTILAGGGVKAGHKHGATDDYGFFAVQDKVHVHDLHATMLYLLGVDHTKLTYFHNGRNYRLTDVHGEVVKGILA
ncbi:MAG: DUF1501 domain-containing protein [Fimbriimonadaceae bacterium]|nr:DUF1501 domain-containing protein [Fimbriimonadaceae bacterium]